MFKTLNEAVINFLIRCFKHNLVSFIGRHKSYLTLKDPRGSSHSRCGTPTLSEHLILLLFSKGVREFQAFVLFVSVLSFSFFRVCLINLENALSISTVNLPKIYMLSQIVTEIN